MIDIGKILKRGWHILWNYKVLWIFGILLALTVGSGGGGGGGNGGTNYQFGSGDGGHYGDGPGITESTPWLRDLNDWMEQNVEPLFATPEKAVNTAIWIGVGLLALIIVLSLLTALVRYPSEVAVMRMVDEYEQSGAKAGFRQGWKLGWSRRAFRLWVIDLILSLPAWALLLLLGGLGLAVYFSVQNGSEPVIATSVVAAIGCAFLFLFVFFLLMVFLSLLRHFFARAAALEESGVGDSFRLGWATFKQNWQSAGLMWLVMLGIGIAFRIAGFVLFFLLIPAYLILALPAALVAAIPAAIAFGITSLFASGPLAWIIAALVAIPFFFLVAFAPLTLVGGWYLIYQSSIWTLTYREMKVLEGVKAAGAAETSG